MYANKIYVVSGLGFGDEGKGTTVDYLAHKVIRSTVVRYSGGAQAIHHVIENGKLHPFSQLGSGSFVPESYTHLSKQMLVKIENLYNEINGFEKTTGIYYIPYDSTKPYYHKLTIDPNCCVVTIYHAMYGQICEIARGKNAHGTVGIGIGEAAEDRDNKDVDALKIRDFFLSKAKLKAKIEGIRAHKITKVENIINNCVDSDIKAQLIELYNWYDNNYKAEVDYLVDLYKDFGATYKNNIVRDCKVIPYINDTIILEGSQGALLDKDYGFVPHITKTNITYLAAWNLLKSWTTQKHIHHIGVTRAYATRHGNGPFVTEDNSIGIKEWHNSDSGWQGGFRIGWLDLVSLRYAKSINELSGKVDSLAVTNLDRLSKFKRIKVCVGYEYKGTESNIIDNLFIRDENKIIRNIRAQKDTTKDRQMLITAMLSKCFPIYQEFKGWNKDISKCITFDDLPREAKIYIEFIERELNIPISLISVGPTHEDKIERLNI